MKTSRIQFFVRKRTQDSQLIILVFFSDSYIYGLIKTLIDRMCRNNRTLKSFDIYLKNLKQLVLKNQYLLRMVDNVIKKYVQNAINKTNTASMSVEMPNIERRYFKLSLIAMYSKVKQNEIENLCKRFCKNVKLKLVFTSNKWVRHLRTKILIQLFSIQSLFINLFVLAVMLVMLVKRTNISQPGLMNTLVRIKIHIYTNI